LFFTVPTPNEMSVKKFPNLIPIRAILEHEVDCHFRSIDQRVLAPGEPTQCVIGRLSKLDALSEVRVEPCRPVRAMKAAATAPPLQLITGIAVNRVAKPKLNFVEVGIDCERLYKPRRRRYDRHDGEGFRCTLAFADSPTTDTLDGGAFIISIEQFSLTQPIIGSSAGAI
jgi:hypothetical protein